MQIKYYTTSGGRTKNEDRYSIMYVDGITLCGVYDGHAGKEVSIFLKNHFGKTLLKDPVKAFNSTTIRQKCKNFGLRLNTYLTKYNINSGSTAIVAMIKDSDAIIVNIGDCRGIVCRNGLAIPLTKDHKPGFIEEKKRILQMGGVLKFDKHIDAHRIQGMSVSRSFGDLDVKYISDKPDINRYSLKKTDTFILLASDGLWDTLTNQEVVEFLLEHESNSNKLKQLASYAISKGSTDNITIIMIDLKENEKTIKLSSINNTNRKSRKKKTGF